MTMLSSAALKEKIKADGKSVKSFEQFIRRRGYSWKKIDAIIAFRKQYVTETRTLIVERLTWPDDTFTDLTDMELTVSMAALVKAVEEARSKAFWQNPKKANVESLGAAQKEAIFNFYMNSIGLLAVVRFGKHPKKIRFYCREDEERAQREHK